MLLLAVLRQGEHSPIPVDCAAVILPPGGVCVCVCVCATCVCVCVGERATLSCGAIIGRVTMKHAGT